MTLKNLKQYKIFKNEKLLSLELFENQGFCNINYHLKTSKNSYVLREFKSDKTVNISRDFEFKVQKIAFGKNIATKPVYLDKNKKFMIYKFLDGNHKSKLKKSELNSLIKTVKKLHKIKLVSKEMNLKNELKQYKYLDSKKAKKSLDICNKELRKLQRYKKSLVVCHHDLNPKNILFTKDGIKFIDWEYSGINDSFFDLATICYEFDLNKQKRVYLLKKYLKNYTKKDLSKLESYIKIYKHICKLWFISLENSKAQGNK
ncbi:protein LicA [Malaciobacter pacificus]|uniref:Choline kinase n=1 Tax=Malaciobacter pacificus TaxID=1080223 RepID=A0A5C2H7A1_9BACT|nr:choline kinase family protein [Malaciobacter pacificus]QEP34713.1 choline kinase [Malaciobacter pacificus]GGD46333.1 protein LicA [Malaciobacter pacificus]